MNELKFNLLQIMFCADSTEQSFKYCS